MHYDVLMNTPFYRDVLSLFHREGYERIYKISGDDKTQRYRYHVSEDLMKSFQFTIGNLIYLGKIVSVTEMQVMDDKDTVFFCDACGKSDVICQGQIITAQMRTHCNRPMRIFLSITLSEIKKCYETREILFFYTKPDFLSFSFVQHGWQQVRISFLAGEYVNLEYVNDPGVCTQVHTGDIMKRRLRCSTNSL